MASTSDIYSVRSTIAIHVVKYQIAFVQARSEGYCFNSGTNTPLHFDQIRLGGFKATVNVNIRQQFRITSFSINQIDPTARQLRLPEFSGTISTTQGERLGHCVPYE
jgi:hypothetical protein